MTIILYCNICGEKTDRNYARYDNEYLPKEQFPVGSTKKAQVEYKIHCYDQDLCKKCALSVLTTLLSDGKKA